MIGRATVRVTEPSTVLLPSRGKEEGYASRDAPLSTPPLSREYYRDHLGIRRFSLLAKSQSSHRVVGLLSCAGERVNDRPTELRKKSEVLVTADKGREIFRPVSNLHRDFGSRG